MDVPADMPEGPPIPEHDDAPPRTGDHVYIRMLDEEWVVAYVENGMLACCGWPFTIISVSHCEVSYRATDAEYRELLIDLASMPGNDPRRSWAIRQIEREIRAFEEGHSLK